MEEHDPAKTSTLPAPESKPEAKTETADPDAPLPGEVFVRRCPKCGHLKQTSDQTGKTMCRRCVANATETEPDLSGSVKTGEQDRRGEVVKVIDGSPASDPNVPMPEKA